MNRFDRALRRLVQEFLDGQRSFEDFHAAFLASWTRLPARALTPAGRARWNEIYGLVLTARPDPLAAEFQSDGAIGAEELRRRLRDHPHIVESQ
jgi:hypothetical protein